MTSGEQLRLDGGRPVEPQRPLACDRVVKHGARDAPRSVQEAQAAGASVAVTWVFGSCLGFRQVPGFQTAGCLVSAVCLIRRQVVWFRQVASSGRLSGFGRLPHQTGCLVFGRLPHQAGCLVLAGCLVFGRLPHQTGSLARWCEFQRVSAWCWPQKVFPAPQRLLSLVGASSNECRLGVGLRKYFWLRRDFCCVGRVRECVCAWGGASSLVAPQWDMSAQLRQRVCAHGVERALSSRPRSEAMSDAAL